MSDRAKVVSRFSATILTTYTLPPSLVDQWLIMANDDYIHFVNTDLTYTPSSNDPAYDDGVFSRALLPGEIEVLSYSMDLYYTKREYSGAIQVISTDTKMSRNSGLDGRRREYNKKVNDLEEKIQTLYQQLARFLGKQSSGSL